EALNLLLVMLISFQLYRFLRRPDPLELEILLLLVALGAQCRYETVVLALPVLVAAALKAKSLRAGAASWRLALVPLVFVPVVWQRLLTTPRNEGDGLSATFGVEYVWPHLVRAVEAFAAEPLSYVALAGAL